MIRNSAASAVYKSKRKRIETRLVRTENTSVQPKLTHTHAHAGHTSVRTHMSVCGYNGKAGLSGRALCAVAATEVAENENCCLLSGAANKADFSCLPPPTQLVQVDGTHARPCSVYLSSPGSRMEQTLDTQHTTYAWDPTPSSSPHPAHSNSCACSIRNRAQAASYDSA